MAGEIDLALLGGANARREGAVDRALVTLGRTRRVASRVPHFMSAWSRRTDDDAGARWFRDLFVHLKS